MARRILTRCKKCRRRYFLPMRSSLGRGCKARPRMATWCTRELPKSKTTPWCSILTIPWREKRYISLSRSSIFNRISPSHQSLPRRRIECANPWTLSPAVWSAERLKTKGPTGVAVVIPPGTSLAYALLDRIMRDSGAGAGTRHTGARMTHFTWRHEAAKIPRMGEPR